MKPRPGVEAVIWLVFSLVWSAHWTDHQPWGALAVTLTIGGLVRAAYTIAGMLRGVKARRP